MSRHEDTPTQNSNTLIPFACHYLGVDEVDSTLASSNTILGESLEEIFHNWRDSADIFNWHTQNAKTGPVPWPTETCVVLKLPPRFIPI